MAGCGDDHRRLRIYDDRCHTVGCGEEVSNFYKWDWIYGVLEPGEYRMVYDVFRKTEGAGSAQKYREYIRFEL